VFVRCGENLRELHDEDQDLYTLEKLKRVSDEGLYHFSTTVRRMSADPELRPSVYEMRLTRELGSTLG